MVSSSLLFACAGEKLELTVKARIDGQPAAQARVTVDNELQGLTGADGTFSGIIKKKPGDEVTVLVIGAKPGYRIKPWETTFVVKPPVPRAPRTFAIEADLQAMRYVTIVAAEKGAPVTDAIVSSHGREAGRTDANGVFEYEYKDLPTAGLDLAIIKPGYAVWRKTGPVEPGQRIEAALSRRVTLSITAFVEEYGQSSGIPGVAVIINNRNAGKTDAKGVLVYADDAEPGKKVSLVLSAPGYIPETWKTSIVLEDDVNVQRYFYPPIPNPIRTGIYRFEGNTPNADLREVLSQTELAVASQLFKNSCFREVPSRTLQSDMKLAKLGIEKIIAQGWRDTALKKTVDMIVLGSVAVEEQGFLIETKFYTSGGKLILSQIAHARSPRDIHRVVKEIADAVVEQFPFEGTLVSVDHGRYRINLGKTRYKISRGTVFTLMAPRLDEEGKILGFREIGRLRVNKADENGSWTEVEELMKDEKISIGDRVVRRTGREDGEEGARSYFIVSAKGGLPPDVAPLAGVNIYVDDKWLGATGPDGKAEVPARINEDVSLMLYRHGYRRVSEKVKIEKTRDLGEYTLVANTVVFRIDSQPQDAAVYIDGEKVGKTPILDNRPIPLGFHTVKVAIGGDYRDWEEEIDFSTQGEDRTGERKIILPRDVLKIGEQAEQKGDVDAAVQEYKSAAWGTRTTPRRTFVSPRSIWMRKAIMMPQSASSRTSSRCPRTSSLYTSSSRWSS